MATGAGGVSALFWQPPVTAGNYAAWLEPGVLYDSGTAIGSITIGGVVAGGTVGSVLFVGSGGVLAQDNANFFWDDVSNILKIAAELQFQGTTATVKVNGTTRLDYSVTNASAWTLNSVDNASVLVVAGGDLTGSNAQTMVYMSQTWNTTGAPIFWEMNVTDTASSGNSFLANWKVNNIPVFLIRKDSYVQAAAFSDFSESNTIANFSQFNGVYLSSSSVIAWTSGAVWYGTADTFLRRDNANQIAMRNSTSAQTFRIYNTFTDTSNYERGKFGFSGNILEIGTQQSGTGSVRNVMLLIGNVNKLDYGITNAGAWTSSVSMYVTALVVTSGTQMIQSTAAFTNGAGAAAGTLLNSPAAGDPTKWIPINDNGTTRYIPAW